MLEPSQIWDFFGVIQILLGTAIKVIEKISERKVVKPS